jgi:hypothetical protein
MPSSAPADDYVRFILAMEREEPIRPEEYGPYMLCSPEEARRKYEEEAALFKRIHDDFEPFQRWFARSGTRRATWRWITISSPALTW